MPTFRASRYRLHAFLPDLLDIQRQKFMEFLTEGIARSLRTVNPIRVPRYNLKIVFYPDLYQLTRPKGTVRELMRQNKTYESLLYVPAHLFLGNKPLEDPCWVVVGHIPLMTKRGHFIIRGSLRVLVNQVVRRPGLYFKETVQGKGIKEKRVIFVDFICRRGTWVRVQCDKQERFWVCLKHLAKINLNDFIQGLDVVENRTVRGNRRPLGSDEIEILERIETRLELTASPSGPGEAGYDFLFSRFKNPKSYSLGLYARHQLNQKLGLSEESLQLTANDLRRTKKLLIQLAENTKVVDDIDNLANRRIRPAGDQLEMQLGIGLARLDKAVKQRLERDKEFFPVRSLIDAKPVNQAFREFFGSSNPLAQYLEQLNPLADITHKRRISATGPGGVNRDNANLAMRNIHPTHYGRICPIETPEGKNAGLVNTLTVFGRVTSQGYIETPYYRVSQGQIQTRPGPVYLTTPQEQGNAFAIAPPDLNRDVSNTLPRLLLPARIATELEENFVRLDRMQLEYIGIAPSQQTSIATSLIPFLEHDDANRALMGSNMQRQTVPLIDPERPIVSTGFEALVIGESGHVLQAAQAGIVSYVSGTHITVQHNFESTQRATNSFETTQILPTSYPGFVATANIVKKKPTKERLDHRKPNVIWPRASSQQTPPRPTRYKLQAYDRSNQETALVHHPSVREGEWVQKGDLLADCAASSKGGLALGRNLLVAYLPWEGYNFEDAVVISQRLIFDELYTTIHIEKYETEAREIPGIGSEVITKSALPKISARTDQLLTSHGIVRVGSWVMPGDRLVGKIVPVKAQPLSPYQRMAFDILGVEIPKTKDVSLRVPNTVQGRVVNTQILDSMRVTAQSLKGLPRSRQKYVRISAPSTNKASTRRTLLLKVRIFIAHKRYLQVGDKVAGRHGNKGIISCVLARQDMPYLPDGTPVDMVLNPLGVPSRMNVGQVFECLLGLAGSYLGQEFRITPFDELFGAEASRSLVYLKLYQARLKTRQKWLFQPNFPGKTRVFDGRTGECFDQFVTVGKAYMLKLVHLVEEKIHARATGRYAMITQQPVGGRARHGGQRLGEMEVWALEAYGAAYTLQEMLTRKSDDLDNRMNLLDSVMAPILKTKPLIPESDEVFTARIKGSTQPLQKKFSLGTSEAFRVLLLELQSLCLDLGVYAVTAPLDTPTIREITRQPIDLCDPQRHPRDRDSDMAVVDVAVVPNDSELTII